MLRSPKFIKGSRNVPESAKREVFRRYGIPWEQRRQFEVDHLVPLCLGGENAVSNLWPESWSGRWGAHSKDRLEVYLHKQVNRGKLSLHDAQTMIATNWTNAFIKCGLSTRMTTELTFDCESHTYTLNGRVCPSVTQIIASHVKGWQAGDFYLQRGSAVHKAVALALEDRLDWTSLDPRIEGRTRAILNFIRDTKLRPVEIERRLGSSIYRYAGCVDLLAEDEEGGLTVVDYKSSFEPSAVIQCGGYSKLIELNSLGVSNRGAVVVCSDLADYKVHWITKAELRNAAHVFLAMLSVYGWKEKNQLNQKEAEA